MKNILLYICDPDELYLNRLNAYIEHREYSPFIVRTYTCVNAMGKEDESPEILLINSADMDDLKKNIQTIFPGESEMYMVFLNEGNCSASLADMNLPNGYTADIIDKYQSAKAIYEHLLHICTQRGDLLIHSFAERDKNIRIIGVYSPEDKQIQRSFAFSLVQELEGEQGLFLNFEEFYPDIGTGSGLSDLILAIKEDLNECMNKTTSSGNDTGTDIKSSTLRGTMNKSVTLLESCVHKKGNLDIVPPVSCPYDLKEINDEEWYVWLDQLLLQKNYVYIIINFGCQVPDLCLLELCTEIYMPFSSLGESVCRRFKDMLIFMGQNSIADKIQLKQMEGV